MALRICSGQKHSTAGQKLSPSFKWGELGGAEAVAEPIFLAAAVLLPPSQTAEHLSWQCTIPPVHSILSFSWVHSRSSPTSHGGTVSLPRPSGWLLPAKQFGVTSPLYINPSVACWLGTSERGCCLLTSTLVMPDLEWLSQSNSWNAQVRQPP